MNWKPVYAVLIGTSTLLTYLCGIFIERTNNKKTAKTLLVTSLIINLGILFIFKYFNFINESVFSLLEYCHIRFTVPNLDVLLPVGISFYTFQAIGYTIDVYKREIKAEKHLGIYALFISFFPQLVAGPIERAKNFLPQFRKVYTFNTPQVVSGLKLMLWGMFMKVVVADRVAIYVNAIYNNLGEHSGLSILLATILFAVQIYCDFGGYSLIAVGSAKIMGFNLTFNFNRPYLALNIADFWRRWHISLSLWFRDYLYIPLGGNRVNKGRNYFNLFFTFVVSGIWHGANWTFVIWGALHGIYQIVEKALKIKRDSSENKFSIRNLCRIFVTFVMVDFAWIFFRANSVGDAFFAIKKIFTELGTSVHIDLKTMFYMLIGISILTLKDWNDEFCKGRFSLINHNYLFCRYVGYTLLVVIILLCGVFDSSQFIYFQF